MKYMQNGGNISMDVRSFAHQELLHKAKKITEKGHREWPAEWPADMKSNIGSSLIQTMQLFGVWENEEDFLDPP